MSQATNQGEHIGFPVIFVLVRPCPVHWPSHGCASYDVLVGSRSRQCQWRCWGELGELLAKSHQPLFRPWPPVSTTPPRRASSPCSLLSRGTQRTLPSSASPQLPLARVHASPRTSSLRFLPPLRASARLRSVSWQTLIHHPSATRHTRRATIAKNPSASAWATIPYSGSKSAVRPQTPTFNLLLRASRPPPRRPLLSPYYTRRRHPARESAIRTAASRLCCLVRTLRAQRRP